MGWEPCSEMHLLLPAALLPALLATRRPAPRTQQDKLARIRQDDEAASPEPEPAASQLQGYRLRWADPADGEHPVLSVSKMARALLDKRDKRFLDPDEVAARPAVTDLELPPATAGVNDSVVKAAATQESDPHDSSGQFCVDISEYLDLKWVIKDEEECHVDFNSQCEVKTENVCIDVTETKCEVNAKQKDSPTGLLWPHRLKQQTDQH